LLGGKFRITRLLGAGAMGAVYAIDHELTRHKRALKLLHPSAQLVPDIVQRFLNEASAAGRAGNAHLVETFDAGMLPSGEPYLVMELLEGETLAAFVCRRHALDPPLAAELVAQAAEGIDAAHRAGIIHRDLKPENLFVTTRDGHPFIKIMDFGVSKFETGSSGLHATQAGMMYGSPAYMSPEQFSGRVDIDGRTDLFSLGVVLFECLTGELPFEDSSIVGLMAKVFAGEMRPIALLRPGLPAALVEVVHCALAPDREKRFPTARALAEALAPFRALPARQASDLAFAPTVASEPTPLPCPSIGQGQPRMRQSGAPSSTSMSPLTKPRGLRIVAGVPRLWRARLPFFTIVALGVAMGTLLFVPRSSSPPSPAASVSLSPAVEIAPPLALAPATVPSPLLPAPSERPVEPRSTVPARPAKARKPAPAPTPSRLAPSSSAPSPSSGAESLGLRTDNPFR
jgi:serine/threonine-protein kinase